MICTRVRWEPARHASASGAVTRRYDRADGDARHLAEGDVRAGEQTSQQHAEFVGRARRRPSSCASVRGASSPSYRPERRLGVTDVEGQEHGSGLAKVREPVRCCDVAAVVRATISSPADAMPPARPSTGVTRRGPRATSRSPPPRELVDGEMRRRAPRRDAAPAPAARARQGEWYPGARPAAPSRSGGRARSVRTRWRPTRARAAPARLDQHSRQLASSDVEIVRPLHADRCRRERVERLGGVQPAAERQHIERASVGRPLDQSEPEPSTGVARSNAGRAGPVPPSARRRARAFQLGASGSHGVRDVQRRARPTRTDLREVRRAARELARPRCRRSVAPAPSAEERQCRTRPRGRCGTSRSARSRGS